MGSYISLIGISIIAFLILDLGSSYILLSSKSIYPMRDTWESSLTRVLFKVLGAIPALVLLIFTSFLGLCTGLLGKFCDSLNSPTSDRRLAEDDVHPSEVLIALALCLLSFTVFHILWRRYSSKSHGTELHYPCEYS